MGYLANRISTASGVVLTGNTQSRILHQKGKAMNKIYEFFGIAKVESMSKAWDSRMSSSIGNSNEVYDRYDASLGLHKEKKKDSKND